MSSLRDFVLPDETAEQLYRRTFSEPIETHTLLGAVRVGQILEVAGPSNSGKTTLLLQVAAHAILPAFIDDHALGGREEFVLVIDLDSKIDILRLMAMLNARIQAALSALGRDSTGEELDRIMEKCLSRFYLISCGSSREVLAVLKTIGPFIKQLQHNGSLQLLLVDNISAFYWVDAAVRARAFQPGQAPLALTLHTVHSVYAAELTTLAKQLKLAVLVSKHAFRSELLPGEGGETQWQHKEMMSKPWVDAVAQRIFVQNVGGGVGDLPSKFAANWDQPRQTHRFCFTITDGGTMPIL